MADLADALSSDIQALLSSAGRYFTTQDILKSLGKGILRRDVSRCLYELERYGLVERVNESPPTWSLVGHHDHSTSSKGQYERHRYGSDPYYHERSQYYESDQGYGEYSYEGSYNEEIEEQSANQDDPWFSKYKPHEYTQNEQYSHRGSRQDENPPGDQYSYYDEGSYQQSSHQSKTTPSNKEDIPGNSRQTSSTRIRSDILESLLHSSNPKTATELAYELGLKGASSVNNDLYSMENDGLLRRIYNPASPILWELASRPQREGPSPNLQIHVAPHKRNLPPRMVSMAMTQGGGSRESWISQSGGPPRRGEQGRPFNRGRGSRPGTHYQRSEPHFSSSSSPGEMANKRKTRFSSPLPERPAVYINHTPQIPIISLPSSSSSAFSSTCFTPTLSSIPVYSEHVELIMSNLYDVPSPLTAADIVKATKLDKSSVNSLLYNLERDGMVIAKKEAGSPQWSITTKGKLMVKPKLIATAERVIFNTMNAAPQKVLNSNQIVTLLQGKIKGSTDIIDESLKSLVNKGSITMVMGSDPPLWSIASNAQSSTSEDKSSMGSENIVEPLVVNSTTAALVNDLNSSPMTVLSQYAQANGVRFSTDVLYELGPSHSKKFVVGVTIGNTTVKAKASTKKEAKRMAADLALQKIRATQLIQAPPRPTPPPLSSSTQPMEGITEDNNTSTSSQTPQKIDNTFHNYIAGLARDLHTKLEFAASVPQPGRKVIACFIMEDTEVSQLEVISFGSGTRCVSGDKMDLQGRVINDSHAEVIARRSLRRFFFQELKIFYEQGDEAETIFEHVKDSFVRVKDSIKFHLYISTAPCGDGAQFSRDDTANREPTFSRDHTPTMTSKSQGVLRSKMEGGEGTIPVGNDSQVQTWDGIQQGSRLRTMSCSDKVASWNVLGLQGSLLSLFMKPVYLSSLTLGSLHHHGHLSRAVCCRLDGLANRLPLGCNYRINHPLLGRVDGGDDMKRHTEKTTNSSLNWVINDPTPEIIDGVIGRPAPYFISQIAKIKFFDEFRSVCQLIGAKRYLSITSYSEAKKLAKEYHNVKGILHQYCIDKGYGVWVKKPPEQDQFTFTTNESEGRGLL